MIWIREGQGGNFTHYLHQCYGKCSWFIFHFVPDSSPSLCRKIYQWDDEDSVFALLAAFFPLERFGLTKNWQNLRENKDLTFKIL